MRKVIRLIIIVFIFSGCSIEHRIKNKLIKKGEQICSQYKFVDCIIEDSILTSDYLDSLDLWKIRIDSINGIIDDHKLNIARMEASKEECERNKRNTMAFLRSTYDYIIGEYDKIITNQNEEIQKLETDLSLLNLEVGKTDSLLSTQDGKDSLLLFIVRHDYDCGGGIVREKIYMNKKLDVYKTEYYESN